MREIREVVDDIDGLRADDPDDLDLERLQALIDEYFALDEAPRHLDAWFRLFERFPESDGYGVFWAILHGIEAQPGSDAFVVESVRRRPTHFPLAMVNRMLNGGISSVGGVELLDLLRSVATDERWPDDVREDAGRFLDYQRNR